MFPLGSNPEFPKESLLGRNLKPDDHSERVRVMVRVSVRPRVSVRSCADGYGEEREYR